jgi:hypothetical protein
MPIRSHVGEAAGLGLGRRYGEDCIRVRWRLPPHPLRHPALGYGVENGGEVAEGGAVTVPGEPSSTIGFLIEYLPIDGRTVGADGAVLHRMIPKFL